MIVQQQDIEISKYFEKSHFTYTVRELICRLCWVTTGCRLQQRALGPCMQNLSKMPALVLLKPLLQKQAVAGSGNFTADKC